MSAKDKATGKENKITIQGSSGLSDEEVEKMRKEAQEHEAEDAKKAEGIDARNAADNLIYTAEKTLKDAGDKASGDDKTAVEDKIRELRETMGGEDVEAIKTKTNELSEAVQKVGAAMYGDGSSAGQAGAEGAEASSGEGDVDYTTSADQSADEPKTEESADAGADQGDQPADEEKKDESK